MSAVRRFNDARSCQELLPHPKYCSACCIGSSGWQEQGEASTPISRVDRQHAFVAKKNDHRLLRVKCWTSGERSNHGDLFTWLKCAAHEPAHRFEMPLAGDPAHRGSRADVRPVISVSLVYLRVDPDADQPKAPP